MSILESTKQFFTELGVQFAADIIQGYVLHMLEDFTAEDCYRAITDDIDLWTVIPDKEKDYLHFSLVRRFKPHILKYADRITPEMVLTWLRKKRPDFASVIENYPDSKGYLWLERQVRNVIIGIRTTLTSPHS